MQEGEPDEEEIIDGVRRVTSYPYGFDDADEFQIFLPAATFDQAPETVLQWLGRRWDDPDNPPTLDAYCLFNVAGDQPFFGYK